jgi:hypothetical protein
VAFLCIFKINITFFGKIGRLVGRTIIIILIE